MNLLICIPSLNSLSAIVTNIFDQIHPTLAGQQVISVQCLYSIIPILVMFCSTHTAGLHVCLTQWNNFELYPTQDKFDISLKFPFFTCSQIGMTRNMLRLLITQYLQSHYDIMFILRLCCTHRRRQSVLVISLTVLQTVMLLSVIPCMMIASTALRIISCNIHAIL